MNEVKRDESGAAKRSIFNSFVMFRGHGIKIERPWTLVAVWALLDVICVYWLEMFREPLTSWASPVIIIIWLLAFLMPGFKHTEKT